MSEASIFIKQYLMTAGPTPLPPAVSQVMAEPILYHRAPAFVEVYERALENLRMVFQTSNDVLSFTASGSGAMESAVANLCIPGEPAVVASAGKFGERWAELCAAHGADLTQVEFEWGEKIDPDRVDEAITALPKTPRAVFATQSETSTGVVHDVRALAEVARRHDAILVDRRDLGPRRGRPAAGRVGGRRGRLRVAEVADVPARARLRLGLRAGPGGRRREPRAALLLRLGPHRGRPARASGQQPVHPGGHPVAGARRRPRADRR